MSNLKLNFGITKVHCRLQVIHIARLGRELLNMYLLFITTKVVF